eukprot:7074289-Prymnesium_polylepis.1
MLSRCRTQRADSIAHASRRNPLPITGAASLPTIPMRTHACPYSRFSRLSTRGRWGTSGSAIRTAHVKTLKAAPRRKLPI